MKNGKQGRNPLPKEWNEFQICKELGWSYKELMETPVEVSLKFVEISGLMNSTR